MATVSHRGRNGVKSPVYDDPGGNSDGGIFPPKIQVGPSRDDPTDASLSKRAGELESVKALASIVKTAVGAVVDGRKRDGGPVFISEASLAPQKVGASHYTEA